MRILFHRDNEYTFVKPWSKFGIGDKVSRKELPLYILKTLYQRRVIGCARDNWSKKKVELYKNKTSITEKQINSGELAIEHAGGPWYVLKNANGDLIINPDSGKKLKFKGKALAKSYLSGLISDGTQSGTANYTSSA